MRAPPESQTPPGMSRRGEIHMQDDRLASIEREHKPRSHARQAAEAEFARIWRRPVEVVRLRKWRRHR
jgi:hypothetical protein